MEFVPLGVATVAAAGLAAFASATSQGMNTKGALPTTPPPNTQETIDLWAKVQAAIQKRRLAMTEQQRVDAGNELDAASKAYDAYLKKTSTAPAADTAAAPKPSAATPPPSPPAPAASSTASTADKRDPITVIVDEAIEAATKAAADDAANRAALDKRREQIEQHEYGGKRKKKGTRRRMHGGDRLLDALESLGEGSPSPRPAFMKLIKVSDEQVALRLVPTFNTFIKWEQSINGSRLFPRMLVKGNEVFQKKFADALFKDVPSEWSKINPVFKKLAPISNYVRAADALAAVAANRPRELTAEEAAVVDRETEKQRETRLNESLSNTFLPPEDVSAAAPVAAAAVAETLHSADSTEFNADDEEKKEAAAAASAAEAAKKLEEDEAYAKAAIATAKEDAQFEGNDASTPEQRYVNNLKEQIKGHEDNTFLAKELEGAEKAVKDAKPDVDIKFESLVLTRMKYASTKTPEDYTSLEKARAEFVKALGGDSVSEKYTKDIIKTDKDVIEGAKDAYRQIYLSYKDTIDLPPGASRAAVKDVIAPIRTKWWNDRNETTKLGIVLTGSGGTTDAMKIIGKSEVYAAASKATEVQGADGGDMLLAAYGTALELGAADVTDPALIIAERRRQTVDAFDAEDEEKRREERVAAEDAAARERAISNEDQRVSGTAAAEADAASITAANEAARVSALMAEGAAAAQSQQSTNTVGKHRADAQRALTQNIDTILDELADTIKDLSSDEEKAAGTTIVNELRSIDKNIKEKKGKRGVVSDYNLRPRRKPNEALQKMIAENKVNAERAAKAKKTREARAATLGTKKADAIAANIPTERVQMWEDAATELDAVNEEADSVFPDPESLPVEARPAAQRRLTLTKEAYELLALELEMLYLSQTEASRAEPASQVPALPPASPAVSKEDAEKYMRTLAGKIAAATGTFKRHLEALQASVSVYVLQGFVDQELADTSNLYFPGSFKVVDGKYRLVELKLRQRGGRRRKTPRRRRRKLRNSTFRRHRKH